MGKYLADFRFFESTTSTFDEEGQLVIAAHQTNGRGRLDRPFFCDAGGIYLCLRTEIMPLLTVRAAVAVLKLLDSRGINAQVKWVNDIIIGGKKVCGILTKSVENTATIGIGINYHTKINEAVSDIAANIFGSTAGINKFTADLVFSLKQALKTDEQEIFNYYRARLTKIPENNAEYNALVKKMQI